MDRALSRAQKEKEAQQPPFFRPLCRDALARDLLRDQSSRYPEVDYAFDARSVIVPVARRSAVIGADREPAIPELSHLLAQVPAGDESRLALVH